MRRFPEYELTTLNDLSPGDLFLIALGRGVTTIALAVESGEDEGPPDFIALSPPEPSQPGLTITQGRDSRNAAVIALREAQIVLPQDPAVIDLEAGGSAPRGALVLVGDRLGICAGVPMGQGWIFDVRDGSNIKRAHRQAAFTAWKIVSPDENGKMQTLCTMPPAAGTSFG